jgi:SSS family transporter
MGFTTIDMIIVVAYMAASVGFGTWIGRKQKDTTEYFLGSRRIPWLAVTFSIIATETSVLTFISIPALSYLGNMTFLQVVFGYITGRILVALLFIPAYYKGEMQTAYHFLGDRFGRGMRNTASITFMVTRILADGVRLFATAIPLAVIIKGSGVLGDLSDKQFYLFSILFIGILTIIYTYVGGIRAVIWMDVIQMVVYMGGAVLAGAIIMSHLPNGYESITSWARAENKFQWLNFGTNLSFREFIKQPYTFITALIGGSILSLASHGIDQLIVQRVLTCKDSRAGQKAISVSGFGVLIQFLVFLVLGIMLYAFYQGLSPTELGVTRADGIFPKFIVEEMPSGISGLIVAALFAAAMSTLSSSLSSLSSAAVLDIYMPFAGKGKSEAQLLKISRLATLGWGLLLILVAMAFITLEGAAAMEAPVVELALSIASYTYGGLLGVFLLGMIFKKATQPDAIIALAVALIVMVIVMRTIQIAWPLYTPVGVITTIVVGMFSKAIRK